MPPQWPCILKGPLPFKCPYVLRCPYVPKGPTTNSFEYTGTGLEKFLGFLIALVVLAVYLGLLQVVLSFIGFSLWGAITSEPRGPMDVVTQLGATYVTGLAVLPLIFFAQYRARRYMLSAPWASNISASSPCEILNGRLPTYIFKLIPYES